MKEIDQLEIDSINRLFQGVNKSKFAEQHKVPGGKSMINQHIHGHRPISLEAAMCYAKAFGCTLSEVSPRIGRLIDEASALQRGGKVATELVWPFVEISPRQWAEAPDRARLKVEIYAEMQITKEPRVLEESQRKIAA